jgi:hypothetical protein
MSTGNVAVYAFMKHAVSLHNSDLCCFKELDSACVVGFDVCGRGKH